MQANVGREFATDSRGNRFTCVVKDDAILITRATGTEKRATKKRIELFCDRFNQTKSFAPADYNGDLTAAASQLLLLTRLILQDASAEGRRFGGAEIVQAEPLRQVAAPAPGISCAQALPEGTEQQVPVSACAHDTHTGPRCSENSGMDFHYDAAGVDERAPLLYLWTIHDATDRIWYCYVGKAKGGADRPKKAYSSVMRRLLTGLPYRRDKAAYRVVHRRMAEAIEKGFTIRLRLVRNVLPHEDIFGAEAQARAHFSAHYGLPCG